MSANEQLELTATEKVVLARARAKALQVATELVEPVSLETLNEAVRQLEVAHAAALSLARLKAGVPAPVNSRE